MKRQTWYEVQIGESIRKRKTEQEARDLAYILRRPEKPVTVRRVTVTTLATTALALALTLTGLSGHAYPGIGTDAYSAGCTITGEWEDGSATAYCPEDGASYAYDADGDVTTGKLPGWYAAK